MSDFEASHPSWQLTRSERGPDLKLFQTRFDWRINPRNGHEEKMVLLEGGEAVQIVARTPADELLLVEQYRIGVDAYIYELPGGLIDPGESPLAAARRELAEETGYTGQSWRSLGRHAANPVFMTGWIHHFAVEEVMPTQAQQLDPGEQIRLRALPASEVKAWLLAGKFVHPHTVCALLAYFFGE